MDFTFTDEQLAVSEAAQAVFAGMAGTERRGRRSSTATTVSTTPCGRELAKANLLGLAVPEDHGGSGLGMTEVCLVLEQQGRAVAPVPVWATTVLGAMPMAQLRHRRPEGAVVAGGGVGRGAPDGRAQRGVVGSAVARRGAG